jgi:hypothetical protein
MLTPLALAASSFLATLPAMAANDDPAAAASAGIRCAIHAERDATRTRLAAIITGSGPLSGSYVFSVLPRGGGAPVFDERRDFTIEGGEPSEVKRVSTDLPPGEGYEASLTVVWPNGSASCQSSIS